MNSLAKFRSVVLCFVSILLLVSVGITTIGLSHPARANADTLPAYVYTKSFDSSGGTVDGSAVAADSSGNVYVTGQFNGTIIFDGVGGSDSHTSLNEETFLTKYNANGTYGWTKTFDDTSQTAFGDSSDANELTIDSSGNIYLTGQFQGPVTFDGVGGSDSVSSSNFTTFLTKYNANGTYGWTKTFDTNSGSSAGQGVVVNKSGDIYVGGYFDGNVTFDGVGGSDTRASTNNVTFLTEYNSNGTYQWTNTAYSTASSSGDEPLGMTIDSDGDIYIVGQWNGTVAFDGVSGDSQSASQVEDAFLTKYNANGTYGWTKITYNAVLNSASQAISVAADNNGNVYVTGRFTNTVVFDGVSGSDSQSSPNYASYLTKINANGTYGWTKITDSSVSGSFSTGHNVVTDYDGSVYVAGSFWGTVVFDGIGGSDSHTSANEASYLTKISASGTYEWTKITGTLASGAFSLPDGLTSDNNGNVYLFGRWHGNVVFDGVGGSDSQTSSNYNVYLTKYEAFTPPPVISNHSSSLTSGSSITVNVLAGATGDPDPNSLSIVSGPYHGTAYDPPGTITYTPKKGYSGPDSLIYRVCSLDDENACSEATLSFDVLAAPLAPNTGFGSPTSGISLFTRLGIFSSASLSIAALYVGSRKVSRINSGIRNTTDEK